jgi:hypothetical protein
MEIAKGEDQWDRILYAQGLKDEAGGGKKDNPLWTKVVYDSYGYLINVIEAEGVKNKNMAEKMVAIIDREKELAEIERKERKRLKNEERRKNKAENGDADGENKVRKSDVMCRVPTARRP